MKFRPLVELFTVLFLTLMLGFLSGVVYSSYLHETSKEFYIKRCTVNNYTNQYNETLLTHCKQSFEIFRTKE